MSPFPGPDLLSPETGAQGGLGAPKTKAAYPNFWAAPGRSSVV